MNWAVAGVVAEIVASVTVVITLFYLAMQIRQNRIAVETASQASMAEGWNAVNNVLLGSQEVAEIFEPGFKDPGSLTSNQRVRFISLGQADVNQFTPEKQLAGSGALSATQWRAHAGYFAQLMASPGGHFIIENVAFSPEILAVFEEFKEAR